MKHSYDLANNMKQWDTPTPENYTIKDIAGDTIAAILMFISIALLAIIVQSI